MTAALERSNRRRWGHRGYIASRPLRGMEAPQHVQNLVIRDFAQRNDLRFKLSATEYSMPGCYMMLNAVLDELPEMEGVICYSMFMLPERSEQRREVYRRVLDEGGSLHAALESMSLIREADIGRFEDVLAVSEFALTQTARL